MRNSLLRYCLLFALAPCTTLRAGAYNDHRGHNLDSLERAVARWTPQAVDIASEMELLQLNRDYRDVDRPTDVLSFECDGYEDGDIPVVEGMSFELGDIVIAPDVAERQAPEFGLSFADEMSLLITHGLLHLCGYDHMQDDEAEIMEAREKELLTKFWGRPFKRSAVEG